MKRILESADPEQRLSATDKARLSAEILISYGRVRWLLHRHDLPSVVATIEAGLPATASTTTGAATVRIGVRLARPTSRFLASLPTDSRCLVRSLVLMSLLVRRGVTSALVIAVRPGEDFAAHAWVERDTTPLLPTGGGAYSRLVELGQQSSATPT